MISGTAQQGQPLTASNGSWTNSPTAFAYQWQDCDSAGAQLRLDLRGDDGSYTLAAGDVGHTIRVVVVASNAGGPQAPQPRPATAVVGRAAHDPVVVAVGDIACAPGDTSNNCEQALTESLAAAQHPDAVLPLGDNQYNSGLLSEYTGAGAYSATWGIFNPIALPDAGQPRVHGERDRIWLFQLLRRCAPWLHRLRALLLLQPRHVAHHLARLQLQRLRLQRRGER